VSGAAPAAAVVAEGVAPVVGAAPAHTPPAHMLRFRGIRALPPTGVTLLGLLSPLVATTVGRVVLGQELTAAQVLGAVVVLAALVVARGGGPTGGSRPEGSVRTEGSGRPAAGSEDDLVRVQS
jgi:probable blue pigment (indigoidine) exporter